eukprot:sb/3466655/
MVQTSDSAKWQLPGWRIEQRFSKGCLIGNWEEDRRGKSIGLTLFSFLSACKNCDQTIGQTVQRQLDITSLSIPQFVKGTEVSNSSHRTDYKPYGAGVKPDTTVRRNALSQAEGLGKDYLFRHHGDTHEGSIISWYDVDYNGRSNTELPAKRTWDPHKLCWLPETSDVPTKVGPHSPGCSGERVLPGKSGCPVYRGDGTRFGLVEKMKSKWAADMEPAGSVTKSSYPVHKISDMTTNRKATPKFLSSHFTAQGCNKDLALRGGPILPPRPEHPANLQVPERFLLPQYTNAQIDQTIARNKVAAQRFTWDQEPTETSKQPIGTRYLGHVTGY